MFLIYTSVLTQNPETGVQGEGETGATVSAIQRSPDLPQLHRQARVQTTAVEPSAGDEDEKDHTTARGIYSTLWTNTGLVNDECACESGLLLPHFVC